MIENLNYTAIPNIIFDEHMNDMTGAELKVIMCICRKTIGWHKLTDRISQSQISQMTGLSVNAIKKAVCSLVDKKLIIQEQSEQGFYYELNISKSDTSENDISENDREGYQKVIEGVSKSDREKPETLSKNDSTKESINKLSKENIKKAKFEKPDFQTVNKYIIDKKYNVDSRMFFDFYNEADWIDSNGKQVRNWKQKVITWHNRNKNNPFKPQEKSYREQLDERYPLI